MDILIIYNITATLVVSQTENVKVLPIFLFFLTVILALFASFGLLKRYKPLIKKPIYGVGEVISADKTWLSYGSHFDSRDVYQITLAIDEPLLGIRQVTIKQAFKVWDKPLKGDIVNIIIDSQDLNRVLIIVK